MSNEITITNGFTIRNGNLIESKQTSFRADMTGLKGPTPGSLSVTVDGVDVSLTQLTALGGMAKLINVDPTNKIVFGVRDVNTNVFYPVLDILAGEDYTVRLSSYMGSDEAGTGTFVVSQSVPHVKAEGAACDMIFAAYDL